MDPDWNKSTNKSDVLHGKERDTSYLLQVDQNIYLWDMTSCSHVARPPASRWWIVSVGRWRTWSKNLAGVVTRNRQNVSGTVERGERGDWEKRGLEGSGTGSCGVRRGREWQGTEPLEPGGGRGSAFLFYCWGSRKPFRWHYLQTGDRQETDRRQVKWSHHAKKHGHRKNPNLIHWTYPCVYTTRALIRLKIGFTGKRLWKDIDILGLSRFTHGPKWSGKDAEQAKFFLNHVDILLLVMTAIAWICSFFR